MRVLKRSRLPRFSRPAGLARPRLSPYSWRNKWLCCAEGALRKASSAASPALFYTFVLCSHTTQRQRTPLSFVRLASPLWSFLLPSRSYLHIHCSCDWKVVKETCFRVKTSVQEGSCHGAQTNENARPLVSPSGSETAEGERAAWLPAAVSGRSGRSHPASSAEAGLGGKQTFGGQLLRPQFGQLPLPFSPSRFFVPCLLFILSLTISLFLSLLV